MPPNDRYDVRHPNFGPALGVGGSVRWGYEEIGANAAHCPSGGPARRAGITGPVLSLEKGIGPLGAAGPPRALLYYATPLERYLQLRVLCIILRRLHCAHNYGRGDACVVCRCGHTLLLAGSGCCVQLTRAREACGICGFSVLDLCGS